MNNQQILIMKNNSWCIPSKCKKKVTSNYGNITICNFGYLDRYLLAQSYYMTLVFILH